MDDFVGLDIVSLRKILCQTIIESCGWVCAWVVAECILLCEY